MEKRFITSGPGLAILKKKHLSARIAHYVETSLAKNKQQTKNILLFIQLYAGSNPTNAFMVIHSV